MLTCSSEHSGARPLRYEGRLQKTDEVHSKADETTTEVLEIERGATKVEIKKAYHKAARTHHPDKVPESERKEADDRFKTIQQAYEILYDDDNRELYDQHGMAAFEKGGAGGGGAGPDLDDILAQMFGGMGGMPGGMGGGMPGMPGMGGRGGRGGPRKSRNEEQEYEVSLEDLYKGKTTRFASTKNVICSLCNGSGGKEKAKSKQCGTCGGQGTKNVLRPVGPGLVTQETVACSTCSGRGLYYADKDKCKKCKGNRTVSQKKILELYIPPGARQGERIVLAGEADQVPDTEPGDIIFDLVEAPHKTFNRAGSDLQADLHITLAEALTGFHRVVLTHLDGRGISLRVNQPKGKILRPEQILRVEGEGMPIKRSDAKGDLYLTVKIDFPEDGWLGDEATIQKIRDVLPKPSPEISADVVDEVEFDVVSNLDDFGADSDDPRGGAAWEDEEEEGGETAQCAQQ